MHTLRKTTQTYLCFSSFLLFYTSVHIKYLGIFLHSLRLRLLLNQHHLPFLCSMVMGSLQKALESSRQQTWQAPLASLLPGGNPSSSYRVGSSCIFCATVAKGDWASALLSTLPGILSRRATCSNSLIISVLYSKVTFREAYPAALSTVWSHHFFLSTDLLYRSSCLTFFP